MTLSIVRVLGWLAGLGLLVAPVPAQQVPELPWTPRSDWINVRTQVAPAAVGDGVADDTAALQAALDQLSEQAGRANTVYLPAGTYRLTKTLVLAKRDGVAVIGHGRATRLVWDGPAGTGDDSRMFWSQGAPRSRYVGLTWDGQGKAHVGFDHDSHSLFETEIDHQHEAFLNFTGAGLRVGHNQTAPGSQAAAETTITNCLFHECQRGVALLQFNDYNFTIAGCEFVRCGTGVYGGKGCNFYVRDSHFEGSAALDIRTEGEHSCSVRRCTSRGARQFLVQNSIAPLTVQDCQVARWTGPAGAISLNGGPVVLFDCVFTEPPTRQPPVTHGANQRLVLSNNRSDGTDGLTAPGQSAHLVEVPAGQVASALTSADQRFLHERVPMPGRVFDARRDFGAKGDGKADDTAAVQAALAAAREQGQGAVAYLPSGDYVIRAPLELTGQDYTLAGSGTRTRLRGQGLGERPVVHVHDPQNLTLENLDIGHGDSPPHQADVLQTGSDNPSSMHYRRVWVYGMYRKDPFTRGLQFRDLPAGTRVRADHVTGNLRFTNCAPATFLFNSSYEGAVVVEGRAPAGAAGLLGFQTRLATINRHGVYVRDSQSLVMSDYYVESADRLMDFAGSAGDPPGRVTIQMAKTHCAQNPVIEVRNYRGQIVLGPTMFYPGGIHPAEITQDGDNPLSFVLLACQAYQVTPVFRLGPAGKGVLLANAGQGIDAPAPPDTSHAEAAAALDDLRALGRLDVQANDEAATAPLPTTQR